MTSDDFYTMIQNVSVNEMKEWPTVYLPDIEELSDDTRFGTYTYSDFVTLMTINVVYVVDEVRMLDKKAAIEFVKFERGHSIVVWAKEKPEELVKKTVNIEHLQKEKPDLPKYQSLINILNAMLLIESARNEYNGNLEQYFVDIEEAFDDTTDDAKEFMSMIYDMYYNFKHFDKDNNIDTYQELYNRLKGSSWLIS